MNTTPHTPPSAPLRSPPLPCPALLKAPFTANTFLSENEGDNAQCNYTPWHKHALAFWHTHIDAFRETNSYGARPYNCSTFQSHKYSVSVNITLLNWKTHFFPPPPPFLLGCFKKKKKNCYIWSQGPWERNTDFIQGCLTTLGWCSHTTQSFNVTLKESFVLCEIISAILPGNEYDVRLSIRYWYNNLFSVIHIIDSIMSNLTFS